MRTPSLLLTAALASTKRDVAKARKRGDIAVEVDNPVVTPGDCEIVARVG